MPAPIPNAPPALDSPQQRVINLAREIEKLAAGGLAPQEFFPQFLEKVVSAVAAQAGAIWLLKNGRLELCCELRLKETGFQDSAEIQRFHQRVLSEVASEGQTRMTHTDDAPEVTFATRHLLVLAALWANGSCKGVVEIFQRPDVSHGARSGYLQFVEQMAGYASLVLKRGQPQALPLVTNKFDNEMVRFGLQLQRSLRVHEVAAVVANDGRLLVGCDRVSVILQRGQKINAEFVSGQETIHRRSNLVKSMVRLSRDVIKSGIEVKYTGTTDSFAPQVKEKLADFAQESAARMVFVLPLRAPTLLVVPDTLDDHLPPPGRVIGCLVLEQFAQSELPRESMERLDVMVAYAAAALHNAQTHQAIFLLPLWTALGAAATEMHGRKLLKTLAALAVIAIVTCVLIFVKIDFRVEGDGRLMPVQRREVFVPHDAEVIDVLVASGDRVNAGQLLVRMRNNELRSEIIVTESQLDEKRKLISALQAERDEFIRSPTGERGNRIEGELAKTIVELRGLERKAEVLQDRVRLLNVTSPIAGVVSTFEVDKLLRYRPVRRGEILLEVMNDAGPWQLELNVDEHRTGHLFQAQTEATEPLPIEFLLVTSPERTYQATLKEVGTRVVTSVDNKPVFEVLASPKDDPQLVRRIGAQVRAKLHCGRTSVGYVLFGDVIEFIQKYLWL